MIATCSAFEVWIDVFGNWLPRATGWIRQLGLGVAMSTPYEVQGNKVGRYGMWEASGPVEGSRSFSVRLSSEKLILHNTNSHPQRPRSRYFH